MHLIKRRGASPPFVPVLAIAIFCALLIILSGTAPVDSQTLSRWVDVTTEAGVRFYQEPDPVVPYGGGTVWSDVDNDGWEDLFLSQYSGCSRLLRNLGDGSFERIVPPGLEQECTIETRGASMADYDNDGDQDLYLSVDGQNRLMRNELIETGALAFTDVSQEAGMIPDNLGNSASAVWGDFNNDGYLDLFVTNHSQTISFVICAYDQLYLNNTDGTFRSVGQQLGVSSGQVGNGCGLAAAWSDYDADGDLDLMVINDFGHTWSPNRLFRNDGPGGGRPWRFKDVSFVSGFDYQMFGMGIGIGDYDRDGDLDYYMADIGDNNLGQNQGNGTFVDRAALAGVLSNEFQTYLGSGLVSWGGVFADLDRDGWEDLLVSNGGAPADLYPGMFGHDYINENPVHIYRNLRNGTFVEGHDRVGLDDLSYHRSVAIADYDKDGDLDVHFGAFIGDNHLYRHDQPEPAHWLQVKTVGTVGNRDGIGTRLRLESAGGKQIREIHGGSSFLANNSRIAFFGVGDAEIVDRLEAVFPSGARLELFDLAVDQLIEVAEPVLDLVSGVDGSLSLHNRLDQALQAELDAPSLTAPLQLSVAAAAGVDLTPLFEGFEGVVEVRLGGRVIDRTRLGH